MRDPLRVGNFPHAPNERLKNAVSILSAIAPKLQQCPLCCKRWMPRQHNDAGCGGGTHNRTRYRARNNVAEASLLVQSAFDSYHKVHNYTDFFAIITNTSIDLSTTASRHQLCISMPAGGAGGGGGGNGPGGGGSRVVGTGTKKSRQTASKGVDKKVAKQPVKAIKEKVLAVKEKAKAKKAEQKASHDARKANYDNKGDAELRQERTTRQQAQGRY
jgi:hypothetical protein